MVDTPETIAQGTEESFVNSKFAMDGFLQTYNTILLTESLAEWLVPGERTETNLVLSTIISSSNASDELVYNNLAELVASSNQVGRRNVYSIGGNQQMAYQYNGNDVAESLAKEDRQLPAEIDADSSQRIVILPPTGTRTITTSESDFKGILGKLHTILTSTYMLKNMMFK